MNIKQVGTLLNGFSVKSNSEKMYRFLAYSFIFSWLLLLAFLVNVGGGFSLLGGVYSFTIPLYYYLLFLLMISVLLPILWLKRFAFLIVVPKILFDIVLIGDFFLFGVYRFHVDMMFINMLIHDFKGIGISVGLVVLAVVVGAIVAAINVFIYRRCHKFPHLKLYKINLAVFAVFLCGQMVHLVSYEYRQVEITKYTPYFPYYAPLTSNSLMTTLKSQFPETFPEVAESGTGQVADILSGEGSGLLTYPKAPLQCAPSAPETLPNILIFVAESWRQDVMDEETTPNIAEFSQSAIQFNNHYSGGNVTVNGLFSLMYGLHPTYRDYMSSEPFKNQTLLTKTLVELGYDIDVYTSSNLDRFSLKPMFFGDIDNDHYVNPLAGNLLQNDADTVAQLLADIRQLKHHEVTETSNAKDPGAQGSRSQKPWFKFVFLSASHHNYQYPPELEIHTPIENNPERFIFNKDMDPIPLFNRYKNSIHYIDSMFGDIWQALERQGQTDNTLAIVTSDHGEEFNDNQLGFWGHGNNFTKYQLAVPMYLKPANTQASKVSHLTPNSNEIVVQSSHIDIVPTIMQSIAQCTNPITDYSNGFNLFDLPQQRDGIIAASYKDKAYIIEDMVYATGISVDSYDVTDLGKKNENYNYSGLNKLKQQESQLLKR